MSEPSQISDLVRAQSELHDHVAVMKSLLHQDPNHPNHHRPLDHNSLLNPNYQVQPDHRRGPSETEHGVPPPVNLSDMSLEQFGVSQGHDFRGPSPSRPDRRYRSSPRLRLDQSLHSRTPSTVSSIAWSTVSSNVSQSGSDLYNLRQPRAYTPWSKSTVEDLYDGNLNWWSPNRGTRDARRRSLSNAPPGCFSPSFTTRIHSKNYMSEVNIAELMSSPEFSSSSPNHQNPAAQQNRARSRLSGHNLYSSSSVSGVSMFSSTDLSRMSSIDFLTAPSVEEDLDMELLKEVPRVAQVEEILKNESVRLTSIFLHYCHCYKEDSPREQIGPSEFGKLIRDIKLTVPRTLDVSGMNPRSAMSSTEAHLLFVRVFRKLVKRAYKKARANTPQSQMSALQESFLKIFQRKAIRREHFDYLLILLADEVYRKQVHLLTGAQRLYLLIHKRLYVHCPEVARIQPVEMTAEGFHLLEDQDPVLKSIFHFFCKRYPPKSDGRRTVQTNALTLPGCFAMFKYYNLLAFASKALIQQTFRIHAHVFISPETQIRERQLTFVDFRLFLCTISSHMYGTDVYRREFPELEDRIERIIRQLVFTRPVGDLDIRGN